MSPITQIQIATSKQNEQEFLNEGFTRVFGFLNPASSASLWYKKGEGHPVTRVQFSFQEGMSSGLMDAGFKRVSKFISSCCKTISMWYMSGSTEYDIPITDLKITSNTGEEPSNFHHGWERLGCNLNPFGCGDPIYVWVKRAEASYICDLECSIYYGAEKDLFDEGYIRVDEDTNRGVNPKGAPIFLFYRRSKKEENAVTNIDVSITDNEIVHLQRQDYTMLNQNLNDGTNGYLVFLWYKKKDGSAVKFFNILVGQKSVEVYQKAGMQCVMKNLNAGNEGLLLKAAYK